MKKESPIDPSAFAGWTFIVALWYFLLGSGWHPYLIIAFIYLILSIGIWRAWQLARIAMMIFSLFIIVICSFLIYGVWLYFTGRQNTWSMGVGLIFFFPSLLLSIYSFDFLNRPKIKEQFRWNIFRNK